MAAVPSRHRLRADLPADHPPVAAAGAGHPGRYRRGGGAAHPGRPGPSRGRLHAGGVRADQGRRGADVRARAVADQGQPRAPAPLARRRVPAARAARAVPADPPGTAGYLTGEALDVLLRTGDVPLTAGRAPQVAARHARALGGAGPEHTWARLFLTMPEAAALAVLLVCDQGWNRSVLDAMTVPDDMPGAGEDEPGHLPGAGSSSAAARPAPGTRRRTWPTPGRAAPGRLIRQAIEATEPARDHPGSARRPRRTGCWSAAATTPAGKTMFCLGARPATACAAGPPAPGWPDPAGAGAGQPAAAAPHRAGADPPGTSPEHASRPTSQVYVLRDPATRPEAEQVTAQGLSDAVGHARATS